MSYGLRHQATPLAQQAARRTFWRQRGFVDGKMRRKATAASTLLELGGELALHAYRAGFRSGEQQRERRAS